MAISYCSDDPQQDMLLPASLQDWLPKEHLAYFIGDTVDALDDPMSSNLREATSQHGQQFQAVNAVGRVVDARLGSIHQLLARRVWGQAFICSRPNLPIYDKLIRDFTPTTPKCRFKGITELATAVAEVITGETYEQRGDLGSPAISAPVQVNVFNFSKINPEGAGA